MTPIEVVAEMLKVIVQCMAERPEQVQILISEQEGRYPVLTIQASRADEGRIIGAQGRRIKALRLVMDAVSDARQAKFTIEIHRRGDA